MKVVAVLSGRYHPFHRGHKASYDYLVNQYGKEGVFIASTNTQAPVSSPFPFEDKKKMMMALGVPANRIIQVKSPYQPVELTDRLDKSKTAIVFAVSEKDTNRFSFKAKKDGSPAYLQPMRSDVVLGPMSDHGYVEVVPTVMFKVGGKDIKSASEIRTMYLEADDAMRETIITDLYGDFKPEMKKLFDHRLGLTEALATMMAAHKQNLLESGQTDLLRRRLSEATRQERIAEQEFIYKG